MLLAVWDWTDGATKPSSSAHPDRRGRECAQRPAVDSGGERRNSRSPLYPSPPCRGMCSCLCGLAPPMGTQALRGVCVPWTAGLDSVTSPRETPFQPEDCWREGESSEPGGQRPQQGWVCRPDPAPAPLAICWRPRCCGAPSSSCRWRIGRTLHARPSYVRHCRTCSPAGWGPSTVDCWGAADLDWRL